MGDIAEYYDSRGEGSLEELKIYGENASRDKIELFQYRYNLAKSAKIGSSIVCPTCGRGHIKTTYHKIFDNPKKCKDTYWNTVSDKRRERAKKFK